MINCRLFLLREGLRIQLSDTIYSGLLWSVFTLVRLSYLVEIPLLHQIIFILDYIQHHIKNIGPTDSPTPASASLLWVHLIYLSIT
jgi:hypothetical protein